MTVAACGDASGPPPPPPVDAGAPGEGALRVLLADGLTLGSTVAPFERATGCEVDAVRAGTSADIVRAAPARDTDIYAVSGEAVLALVAAGAAEPIARGRDDAVPAALRRAGDVGGVRFGVPFAWGPELLLTAVADPGPTTWTALYAPEQRGRIAVPDDPFQVALAAHVLGTEDPYALGAADLTAAAELIRRQRPLVREYWRDPSDLVALFDAGRVTVAQGRGQMARRLAPLGVAAIVPDGPLLAWSTWFVAAADAPHPRCAAKWLNHALSAPVQISLAGALSAAPAVLTACPLLGAEACAAARLDDEAVLERMIVARTPRAPTGIGAWEQVWSAARR